MKNSEITTRSFLNALGTLAYIVLIATFFFNAEAIFGHKEDTFLIPVMMLLLFIISALITSSLVLGKPILLYLNGHKKDALTLLGATLLWLVIFALVVMISLIVI